MSEENTEVTKQKVVIDGTEYLVDDLNQEQIKLVNMVADIDRKISSAMFNVEQMQGGREFWMTKLKDELAKKQEEAA